MVILLYNRNMSNIIQFPSRKNESTFEPEQSNQNSEDAELRQFVTKEEFDRRVEELGKLLTEYTSNPLFSLSDKKAGDLARRLKEIQSCSSKYPRPLCPELSTIAIRAIFTKKELMQYPAIIEEIKRIAEESKHPSLRDQRQLAETVLRHLEPDEAPADQDNSDT